MPKKTRRQKIHAALRREALRQKPDHSDKVRSVSQQIAPPEEALVKALTPEESQSVSFFKSDFKRSLLFIILIIGLEISLYFASINQYLKLGE